MPIDFSQFHKKNGVNNTRKIEPPKVPKKEHKKSFINESNVEKKIVQKNAIKLNDNNNIRTRDNILSKLEYKMFRESVEIIYKSNYMRYKNSKSTGMLNALINIKETVEIIGKRLGYNQLKTEKMEGDS